jgi:hypothetical protein
MIWKVFGSAIRYKLDSRREAETLADVFGGNQSSPKGQAVQGGGGQGGGGQVNQREE